MAARKNKARTAGLSTQKVPLQPVHAAGAEAIRQSSIGRAKLEWESTVDALASLVCLLDSSGSVVRVNQVVDDWSLGTIKGVLGKDVHRLFHPSCRSPRCDVSAFVKSALERIRQGNRSSFEMHLTLPQRNVRLTIRPMRRPSSASQDSADAFAVLVADDETALARAQDALERLNVSLEGRVRSRTAELAQANEVLRAEVVRREAAENDLRASRDGLAGLSAQLIRVQENERKRIAQELHDSVGQSISAVKYTIERARELLRKSAGKEECIPVLELAVKRMGETAESIRAISTNLRPAVLDDLGGASGLRSLCREFSETYPSIVVKVRVAARDHDIPDRLAIVVYRCAQELLNNVAKHAEAGAVTVRLRRGADGLLMQIQDDGVGIPEHSAGFGATGSGLRNLRERAQLSGGTFTILRGGRIGTLAMLSWELDANE